MTYEEWAATVGRGVTINPQMAFAAGAASRDAEIAELVAALEGYLDAINASARAEMAYANARENFTDSIDEGKAALAALVAASKAEGVARATLAKVRKP